MRKFSTQPYTGSRANGATTTEFKLPRRGKYFKSKTFYYPNSASTFSIQRLLLSGDIELNPGMPTNNCNKSSRPRGRRETTGNIKIAHLNIRSLKNREHLILAKETVISNKIVIFTISESWLDSSVSDAEVEFPGYILHRLDRVNKHGKGVCAFVRQEYRAERLSDISYISESGLHQLLLKIQVRNFKSFLVCTAYGPPNTHLDCFDSDFSNTLVSALSMNLPVFILGDLNCNLLSLQDPPAQTLVSFCSSFNLSQVISHPTRITESTESLIDVALVSNANLVKEAKVSPSSISDHELILVVLNMKKSRPKPIYILTRSYKNYKPEVFTRDLSEVPWNKIETFEDVDDCLYAFHQLFEQIVDRHAPVKKVKIRSRPNPFITPEIRELMRARDKWKKLAHRSNDPLAWAGFRNYKREVKREIRIAEREFVRDQIANNQNNSSGNLWKTIRSILPRKSSSRLVYNQDEESVANSFNEFFTSVGRTTVDKIKALASECNYDLAKTNFVPTHYPLSEQFSFHSVNCKQVEQIITLLPSNNVICDYTVLS